MGRRQSSRGRGTVVEKQLNIVSPAIPGSGSRGGRRRTSKTQAYFKSSVEERSKEFSEKFQECTKDQQINIDKFKNNLYQQDPVPQFKMGNDVVQQADIVISGHESSRDYRDETIEQEKAKSMLEGSSVLIDSSFPSEDDGEPDNSWMLSECNNSVAVGNITAYSPEKSNLTPRSLNDDSQGSQGTSISSSTEEPPHITIVQLASDPPGGDGTEQDPMTHCFNSLGQVESFSGEGGQLTGGSSTESLTESYHEQDSEAGSTSILSQTIEDIVTETIELITSNMNMGQDHSTEIVINGTQNCNGSGITSPEIVEYFDNKSQHLETETSTTTTTTTITSIPHTTTSQDSNISDKTEFDQNQCPPITYENRETITLTTPNVDVTSAILVSQKIPSSNGSSSATVNGERRKSTKRPQQMPTQRGIKKSKSTLPQPHSTQPQVGGGGVKKWFYNNEHKALLYSTGKFVADRHDLTLQGDIYLWRILKKTDDGKLMLRKFVPIVIDRRECHYGVDKFLLIDRMDDAFYVKYQPIIVKMLADKEDIQVGVHYNIEKSYPYLGYFENTHYLYGPFKEYVIDMTKRALLGHGGKDFPETAQGTTSSTPTATNIIENYLQELIHPILTDPKWPTETITCVMTFPKLFLTRAGVGRNKGCEACRKQDNKRMGLGAYKLVFGGPLYDSVSLTLDETKKPSKEVLQKNFQFCNGCPISLRSVHRMIHYKWWLYVCIRTQLVHMRGQLTAGQQYRGCDLFERFVSDFEWVDKLFYEFQTMITEGFLTKEKTKKIPRVKSDGIKKARGRPRLLSKTLSTSSVKNPTNKKVSVPNSPILSMPTESSVESGVANVTEANIQNTVLVD